MLLIKEWIHTGWHWFWYHRRGKISYRVWDYGDHYIASASNGKMAVWNCYGSTPEAAREMALYKFNHALEKAPLD